MITYIKLKNFISFGDTIFDFRKSKGVPVSFAAIYGENGSGKTSFVKSLEMLAMSTSSFRSLESIEKLQKVIDSKDAVPGILEGVIEQLILDNFSTTLEKNRMIGCEDESSVEYGFICGGKNFVYRIAFRDTVTEESLYGWTGKQSGYLYKIRLDENNDIKTSFFGKLFLSSAAQNEAVADIKKFWGKHTFIGILNNQLNKQNSRYTNENYSPCLLNFLVYLSSLTIVAKSSSRVHFIIGGGRSKMLVRNLTGGKISAKNYELLERSQHIISNIFSQLYSDIKSAEYETEKESDDILSYKLYFNKMISGKLRRISIDDESTGTLQILRILSPLLCAMLGMTVCIDEADTGIHDILFNNILEAVRENLKGQLIITTHNTTLLENIHPSEAYIIDVDHMGEKSVVCADEFGLQKSNNPRNCYLKGMLGGVPENLPFDSDEILADLSEAAEPGTGRTESFSGDDDE